MKLSTILTIAAFAIPTSVALAGTGAYYDCGNGYFSDKPVGLNTGKCTLRSVRTGASIPLNNGNDQPMSLADRQAALNAEIAAANKKAEEESAKQEAALKAENCQRAQINAKTAETARNKEEILPRYLEDVARYCN
ncbi:hypothetical protein [Kingella negevensis]|uniref:hypothetical protein n=1 Tax=Kingella negevensis TaxID=1522312 RepID=UPI0006943956|nr:hypothetical protein [Kingella negevensis]MDK4679431.1 hypothetical protein [Kingella negevensis]MDK4682851.1 hypothetical protein [Kingella negevensis]MDK4684872.1 hypothetical protein [Kingella negevensis]MDK4689391.1 hypothetical protein [Kingella negevensis]MDK4691048.1 hypothetical protein [Kingella negevensis]